MIYLFNVIYSYRCRCQHGGFGFARPRSTERSGRRLYLVVVDEYLGDRAHIVQILVRN